MSRQFVVVVAALTAAVIAAAATLVASDSSDSNPFFKDTAIVGANFTPADAPKFCLNNVHQIILCDHASQLTSDGRALKPGGTAVAMAFYSVNMSTAGWDLLEIVPAQRKLSDTSSPLSFAELSLAYYRAGILEGYVTSDNLTQIGMPGLASRQWQNVSDFVQEHVEYMNATAREFADGDMVAETNVTRKFWARVGMMLEQLRGMAEGYNQAAQAKQLTQRATVLDAFLAAFYFELEFDIKPKFAYHAPAAAATTSATTTGSATTTTTSTAAASTTTTTTATTTTTGLAESPSSDDDKAEPPLTKRTFRPTHCSALVKLTSNELWMAHTSWFKYTFTRRIWKTYHFDTSVSMSSYVGFLGSGDDWLITSKELAVFETSLSVFTFDQLKDKITAKAVSEFIRAMVASYVASDAKQWVDLFAMENNGCYNNMFGAVALSKFKPVSQENGATSPTIEDGLMWIAEQLPGTVAKTDVTDVLRAQGYFASYNVAYDRTIFELAGYAALEREYGDYFSYNETRRGQIFRRNQSSVKTTADMQNLIRYNGWPVNDPLSRIQNCSGTQPVDGVCNPASTPWLAIAARGDLAPANATAAKMGPLWFHFDRSGGGAYDGKVARWSDRKKLRAHIISGPSQSNGMPAFSFSANADLFVKEGGPIPPVGLPDVYNFPWIASQPAFDFTAPAAESSSFWNKESVGAIVGGILGVIGLVLVVVYHRNSRVPRAPLLLAQQQQRGQANNLAADTANNNNAYRQLEDGGDAGNGLSQA